MAKKRPKHGTVLETEIHGKVFWMQYIEPPEADWDTVSAGLFVALRPANEVPGSDVCQRWRELQQDGCLFYVERSSVPRYEEAGLLRRLAVCPPAPTAIDHYGRLTSPNLDKRNFWEGRAISWDISDWRISWVPLKTVDRLTDEEKRYPRYWFVTIADIRRFLVAGYRPELDAAEPGAKHFILPPELEQEAREEAGQVEVDDEVVAKYGEPPKAKVTISYWAYFRRRRDALAFAKAAQGPDRFVEVVKTDDRTWRVLVEEPFDGDVITADEKMAALVEQFGGEYDGNSVGPLG